MVCFSFKGCGHFGICANSVVMAVACHKCSVKANVLCLQGRHCFDFCAEEIFFGDAVLFVQKFQSICFDKVCVISVSRDSANEHVEVFTLKCACNGLFIVFL